MKDIIAKIAGLDKEHLIKDMRKRARKLIARVKGINGKKGDIPVLRPEFIMYKKPKSPVAEAYRMIRTHIDFSNVDEKIKTIVVTSSSPREGKTTTVINLGCAFAQASKKTLIMDSDLRNPSLHKIFNLNNEAGFSSIVSGQNTLSDAVHKSILFPNLDVLTSGPKALNPAEAMGSKSARDLINAVRAVYDIAIFDSPPALAVTDAKLLSFNMDGVIMVIKSARIAREVVRKTREAIAGENINLMGVILNDIDLSSAGYYYKYYYSYYNGKAKEPSLLAAEKKPVEIEKKVAETEKIVETKKTGKEPHPAKKKNLFVPDFLDDSTRSIMPPKKGKNVITLLSEEEKKNLGQKKSSDKELPAKNSTLGRKTVFFKKPQIHKRKEEPDKENGDGSGLGKKDIFKDL